MTPSCWSVAGSRPGDCSHQAGPRQPVHLRRRGERGGHRQHRSAECLQNACRMSLGNTYCGYSAGTVLGFSAILLPQLESEMTITSDQKSWIASLSNIGQLFGAVATGILAGKFGK